MTFLINFRAILLQISGDSEIPLVKAPSMETVVRECQAAHVSQIIQYSVDFLFFLSLFVCVFQVFRGLNCSVETSLSRTASASVSDVTISRCLKEAPLASLLTVKVGKSFSERWPNLVFRQLVFLFIVIERSF